MLNGLFLHCVFSQLQTHEPIIKKLELFYIEDFSLTFYVHISVLIYILIVNFQFFLICQLLRSYGQLVLVVAVV